jgi:hypothetical protein
VDALAIETANAAVLALSRDRRAVISRDMLLEAI